MNLYSDLIPRIIADIPACPTQVITQALQTAGYDFCHETECLYEDLTMNIVASQASYTLTLTTAGMRMLRIEYLKNKQASTDSFDDMIPVDSNYYEFENDTTLRYLNNKWPTYSLTSGMRIRVTIVPKETATVIPSWFMNRWYNAIIARTKFILCAQSRKPWSDPNTAMLNDTIYTRYKGEAKREKYAKYKKGDIVAQMIAPAIGGF